MDELAGRAVGIQVHSVDDEPDLAALAPVWTEAIEREGLTSRARVALWLEEHAQPPGERVEMLARRLRGEVRVTALAAEEGVPHSRIQALLRQTALRLIVPHLEDIAAWNRARASGVSDEVIADLASTSPEVVALALDGWPPRDQPASRRQVVSAYEAWVRGAPLSEVATLLGTRPGRLKADLTHGASSLPSRMQTKDLADQFGWNAATVTRHRQEGVLPPPDGQDGPAFWWWKSTIDQWAADRGLHPCASCPALYTTATGLRGHVTREHP